MTRGVCGRLGRTAAAAGLVLAATAGLARAQGVPEINWYTDLESVRAAAHKDGKPIYYFIFYVHSVASLKMRHDTFRSPKVIALLGKFECCAVDAEVPENRAFVERYTLGVAEAAQGPDPGHGVKFGNFPASLFTDPEGHEQYLQWGYIPSEAFPWVVTDVLRMAELKAALAQKPDEPRANVELATVMIRLRLHTNPTALAQIRQYLQQAVTSDPDNRAGAREQALLYQIILDIPADPQKGAERLTQFLTEFPQTQLRPRAVFFQASAIAELGAEAHENRDEGGARARYKQALDLLQPFKTKADDQTSMWFLSDVAKPALELERQLGELLGLPGYTAKPVPHRRPVTPGE